MLWSLQFSPGSSSAKFSVYLNGEKRLALRGNVACRANGTAVGSAVVIRWRRPIYVRHRSPSAGRSTSLRDEDAATPPEIFLGTIDQTTHHFSCANCKTTETVTLYEKGSMWGASWQIPAELGLFAVEWKWSQFKEPIPVKSKCRACGIDAEQS